MSGPSPQMNWDIRTRDKSRPGFRSFDRNLTRADRNVYRLNSSMERATAVSSRLAGGLAASAAALAGIGVAASAIRNVVSETSRLAKNADKVGLLTDEFQRLQFGFGLAGVEAANFTTAMEQFNKRLTEAQTGTGNLRKILEANNVSLFDSSGNMKSVNRLLEEYAELIKNAETSQNKLYLATEAFGRSGGDMVLALRNGAEGIRELAKEADNAGGVIDEELLRTAEQVDDEWTRVARSFETEWKRSVLNVIQAVGELQDFVRSFDRNREIGTALGEMAGPAIERIRNPDLVEDDPLDAFGGSGDFKYNTGQTIIPPPPKRTGGSGGTSSFQNTLSSLQLELSLLGKTSQQRRELNALRRAGVTAASEEGQAILGIVGQINRQEIALQGLEQQYAAIKDRQDAFGDSMGYLGDMSIYALDVLMDRSEDAADALKRLGLQILAVAAQGALLGQGPLAGFFGGGFRFLGGGRGMGQLAGAVSGKFAGLFGDGGDIFSGQWGIAGESGIPEIITGPATVTPLADVVRDISAAPAARSRDTIDIRLLTDSGLIADIADQRIEAQSGAIINLSVEQARRAAGADFAANQRNAQRRRKR